MLHLVRSFISREEAGTDLVYEGLEWLWVCPLVRLKSVRPRNEARTGTFHIPAREECLGIGALSPGDVEVKVL